MDVGVGVACSCRYRSTESFRIYWKSFHRIFNGARFRLTDFLRASSNP